jgi:hypothetical protein
LAPLSLALTMIVSFANFQEPPNGVHSETCPVPNLSLYGSFGNTARHLHVTKVVATMMLADAPRITMRRFITDDLN